MPTEWTTRLRAVVGALEEADESGSALSLAADVDRVVEAGWVRRVELLEATPALLDSSVAELIEDRDRPLALFIQRAAEAGIDRAGRELPALAALNAATDAGAGAVLDAVETAVRLVESDDARWLLPLALQLIENTLGSASAQERHRLGEAWLVSAAMLADTGFDRVNEAIRLVETDWPQVWTELAQLAEHPEESEAAAGVVRGYTEIFFPATELVEYAADFHDLLVACRERGTERAVREHRLVLRAREAGAECAAGDRPSDVESLLTRLLCVYEDGGGRWLLTAGVALGQQVRDRLAEVADDEAETCSLISALLADAVLAGAEEPQRMLDAVALARRALASAGNSADRAGYANNLGFRLGTAVDTGVLGAEFLRESIALHRLSVDSTGERAPERALRLLHLANRISEAVEAGVEPDTGLAEAVRHYDDAAGLLPAGHPDHLLYLVNQGNALALGVSLGVLDPATFAAVVGEALRAVAHDSEVSARRGVQLSNISSMVSDAIAAGAMDPSLLPRALQLQRAAVELVGDSDPNRAALVSNLAHRITEVVHGGLAPAVDLVAALDFAYEAVALTPPDHPARPGFVANLAAVISEAVESGVGAPSDHRIATALARSALEQTPAHHPHWAGRASNVASAAAAHGTADELPEAVRLAERAVDATRPCSPGRGIVVSNFASVLMAAIRAGRAPRSRIGEALGAARDALDLSPAPHPRYAANLSNLAALTSDAVRLGHGSVADLRGAVERGRGAVAHAPIGHPDRVRCVANLAVQLEQAVEAEVLSAPAASRVMLELVDEFWIWSRHGAPSPDQRQHALLRSEGLVAAAIPLVLEGSGPEDAVRVAECVLGCLAASQRAPALPAGVPADTARRYRSAAARYAAAQQRVRDGIADARDSARAVDELTAAVAQVRTVTGFADFAAPAPPSALARMLPADSVAVYPVAGPKRGAALVLTPEGVVREVELPAMTEAAVAGKLDLLLESQDAITDVADWLWQVCAAPLVDAVSVRSWFVVATGHMAMLPLHAAGSSTHRWLDDLVEIRVVPTLRALEPVAGPPASGRPVIGIAAADDLTFLHADRAVAAAHLPGAEIIGPDERVTRDRILAALVDAPEIVLSGHARHSLRDGGCLDVADGPITARGLSYLPPRRRDLAFLMACSSGQIAAELVNESIGLPGALLSAGFRGVCAGMWPIDDRVAFVTLARFFQLRRAGSDEPHVLLREVRRWLRTATVATLHDWFRDTADDAGLLPEVEAAFTEWLAPFGRRAVPMADPVHWAGFSYIGT